MTNTMQNLFLNVINLVDSSKEILRFKFLNLGSNTAEDQANDRQLFSTYTHKGLPSRSPPGQKPRLIKFKVPSQSGRLSHLAVISPALL